jgi:hypothetical protein
VIRISVDLNGAGDELDRLIKGPAGETLIRCESALLAGYMASEARAHVITGQLKASGHPSSSFCVSPEVRVLTSDLRWVPAGEVRDGDHLLAFDEESRAPSQEREGYKRRGRMYRSTVVESAQVIRRPCYDLEFEDGTRVRCSAEHRWLVGGGNGREWKQAVRWATTEHLALRCGQVSKVVKPLEVWQLETSRAAGYLAAAFDGEGCLRQRLHKRSFAGGRVIDATATDLSFAQRDNAMLAETRWCLKQLDFAYSEGVNPTTGITATGINERPEVLRFLGSVRPRRLLARFDPNKLGMLGHRTVRLTSKIYVGARPVVALVTEAHTFFAEGLASHNSGDVWEGEISFARHPGIFELARGDSPTKFHPEGGHYFFDPGGPEFLREVRKAIWDWVTDGKGGPAPGEGLDWRSGGG